MLKWTYEQWGNFGKQIAPSNWHLARRSRPTVAAVGVATLVGLLAACAPSSNIPSERSAGLEGDSASASSVVIALEQQPSNLNPIFGDIYGTIYGGHWPIFSGLVKYDGDLTLVPDLATDLPEVSEDGMTVKVRVRGDATWHDGEPVTAEDVRFTYESILDPAVATAVRGLWFDSLASVESADDGTITFHLNRRDPAFIEKLSMGIIPEHLLAGEDLNTAPYNAAPIGSGPFVFEEARPDESMKLSANQNYYGGEVALSDLTVRFISDPSSRLRHLQAGEIDVDAQGMSVRSAQPFEGDERFQIVEIPGAILTLTLPTTNPFFNSDEVRRALGEAIDRESLLDGLAAGSGRVVSGPFYPGHWSFTDDFTPKYDPVGSKQTLEELGWKENANGVLERNGQEFAFDLVYGHGGTADAAALAIRDALGAIGIKVEPVNLEYAEMLVRMDEGAASLQELGNAYDPELDVFETFHSSLAETKGEGNIAKMKDEAVDAAIIAGREALGVEARAEAYYDLQRELQRQGSWQFLIQGKNYYVLDSRIKGISPQPREGHIHGYSRGLLWNLDEWYLGD